MIVCWCASVVSERATGTRSLPSPSLGRSGQKVSQISADGIRCAAGSNSLFRLRQQQQQQQQQQQRQHIYERRQQCARLFDLVVRCS
jgi:hypothetical protein